MYDYISFIVLHVFEMSTPPPPAALLERPDELRPGRRAMGFGEPREFFRPVEAAPPAPRVFTPPTRQRRHDVTLRCHACGRAPRAPSPGSTERVIALGRKEVQGSR